MVCQSQKLQSPVLVLAAETVLQRWEGKGRCTCGNSLTLESAHIKSPKASTLISVEVGPAGFWSSRETGMWGDIHPTPRAAMGDYGILCKMALQELAASQRGPLSLFFCSVLSLESGLLISSKCLLGNLFLGKRISLNFFKFHIVLDC